MNEHTELPWKVEIRQDNICILSGDKVIALMCVKPDDDHLYKPIVVEANAELILRGCNNHKTLLDACKEQHEAIDRLFAMLIRTTAHDTLTSFFPSKSGQPWEALYQGGAAIEQANEEI